MKQLIIPFFLLGFMTSTQSQSLQPMDVVERLYERINVATQALSQMPTSHDFTEYNFDWNFVEGEWDTLSYTNAYAAEEGGQTNLYLNTYNYDDDTQSFVPSETGVVYGLKQNLGVEINFLDATGTFYADSLVTSFYDEESKTFIPFVRGTLTPHANGKLDRLEIYLNSTGATEPPFFWIPFVVLQMYYDGQDRVIGYTSSDLDLFDLTYSTDSISLILGGTGNVIEEYDYYNETIASYSTFSYESGGMLPTVQVTCFYEDDEVYAKDSIVADYQSPEIREEFLYQWLTSNPMGYELETYTVIGTLGDTSMITTLYLIEEGSPPHAVSQERRHYDEEGRLSSTLVKTDFPFDTLENDYLSVYVYPKLSGTDDISIQTPAYTYRISENMLDISFEERFDGTIELYSASGIPVFRSNRLDGCHSFNIGLEHLPAGVYFTRLSGKDLQESFGFALMR